MFNPFSLFRGAAFFIEGAKLATQPSIRRFVYIPLLINVVVFVALIAVLAGLFGDLITMLIPTLPEWLQWLEWLLWLFFALATVIIVFFTFSILANIIAAPFCALLAEAVEREITGSSHQEIFTWKGFLTSFFPTIWDEIRRLRYTLLWSAVGLLLFVIPLVNLAAPFIWILITSWLLSFEYTSYSMSNNQIKLSDHLGYMRQERLLSLGFGGTTLLATMIPLVNFLVIPIAVIAGTIVSIRLRNR